MIATTMPTQVELHERYEDGWAGAMANKDIVLAKTFEKCPCNKCVSHREEIALIESSEEFIRGREESVGFSYDLMMPALDTIDF